MPHESSQLPIAREEELREAYRNLGWTRIVSMQQLLMESEEMHQIGDDIIEELNGVDVEVNDQMEAWAPIYDPQHE